VTYHPIPETAGAGGRLGRHVHHDPESLRYRVTGPRAAPRTVRWRRHTPILDQGNLGSCTGNAAVGALGTDPFYATLGPDFRGDEADAVQVYRQATRLDPFPGGWEPDDTGSDGLSAAKACKASGYISGYEHALGMDDFQAGMQTRPAIIGINWYSSFDTPTAEGVVSLPKTATVRGGHEVEAAELDLELGLAWCANSWSALWGAAGRFAIPLEILDRLFGEDGDATFFTPADMPAPTPAVTKTFTAVDNALIEDWAGAPHWWRKATRAAAAWNRGV
jgi:hypothetical protein